MTPIFLAGIFYPSPPVRAAYSVLAVEPREDLWLPRICLE